MSISIVAEQGLDSCVYMLAVRYEGGWRERPVPCPVLLKPIGYARHFSRIRLPCPFTQSFDSDMVAYRARSPSPRSPFCQFLSFSLSRSRLSQPASIQARIPRGRGAGRQRIRVQPFLFDAALGTAGKKTCLYIATTIQHRTYKAAA